jgi:hypothetical protein
MSKVIVPRSDQINADDLLSGPLTIKIASVKVSPGTEQPVSIYFDGSDKAYRCCKSMARVLVSAWGTDSAKYIGRSLTLYCDPKVKWGGMEVGGIRISHMSDIEKSLTLALTVTRANKKPFTVKPLVKSSSPSQPSPDAQTSPVSPGTAAGLEPSADEALLIKAEEFASTGTERYRAWWLSITEAQRKAIGEARHATFKQIAAGA